MEIVFQPVQAAGMPKGLGRCFPCTSRANEGHVVVGVDGIHLGQYPQPFYILPLDQREVKVFKGFGGFCGETAHFQKYLDRSLLLFSLR